MISDRPYMRTGNPAKELGPLLWLIGGLVAAFIGQVTVDKLWNGAATEWLALTPANILRGRVWTLFSYSLLHDSQNLWHLIMNALGILFVGRLLLPVLGARRVLGTYVAAILAGGVFWLAVNFFRDSGGPLIGASAGAYGLLALFCCRFAYDRMTVLLFFVVPMTIVPRYFLMVIAAIEGIFFLFSELFPIGRGTGFAHSAHLAGMAAGLLAYRAALQAPEPAEEEEEAPRRAVELPSWMKKKTANTTPTYKVNVTAREDLKAEVDRILDKINTSGFGSLTAEEKRTLDAARALLSKQ